jgi:polyisoprenoid-binding protein YceI
MNTKRLLTYLILILVPLFFALCGAVGAVGHENETNTTAELISSSSVTKEKYDIDIKQSLVTWKGSMAFPSQRGHTGYVSMSKGELMIDKDQLVGGSVIIDMTTITDPVHGSDNSLINHLKDPDFFDVKKFPVSSFAITRVAAGTDENIEVTGILTIKEITHSVTFPAKIDVKGGVINANGKLKIDRTRWDVLYQSGKFYDNLVNGAISDDIEFDLKIVARK